MGAFLDKPKTEKHNDSGSGNGLRYGLSSMQGWRVEMEDAHTAKIGMDSDTLKDWSFFAVFDGHAGAKVSAHCSDALLKSILGNDDFWGANSSTPRKCPDFENVKKGVTKGFLELDEKMRQLPEVVSGEDKSGSTAVIGIMSPSHIFFANCGDSRGVLSRAGAVISATVDHKPVNDVEKNRIMAAGGSVMIQRVNGSLAVSRALGDFEYKNVQGKGPCEQLVSPEPEITGEERSPKDEFLVLACDGIWDVMSNEEVCDFIRNRMLLTDNLETLANQVIDTCLFKGSRDNMSIVIVAFEGAPKVSEDALKKEAELDARLEVKVKEFLAQSEPKDVVLAYVMHLLTLEEIEGLPPGGGLISKRNTVKQILDKLNPVRNETE